MKNIDIAYPATDAQMETMKKALAHNGHRNTGTYQKIHTVWNDGDKIPLAGIHADDGAPVYAILLSTADYIRLVEDLHSAGQTDEAMAISDCVGSLLDPALVNVVKWRRRHGLPNGSAIPYSPAPIAEHTAPEDAHSTLEEIKDIYYILWEE